MPSHLSIVCGVAAILAVAVVPIAAAQEDNCPLSFTAVPQPDGSISFHWSGFGGAEGYQVFGNTTTHGTAAFTAMMPAGSRDATVTFVAPGTYHFWVVAFHSSTVVASSCVRTVTVEPRAEVPFFPTPWAAGIAVVAGAGIMLAFAARRRKA